MYSTVEVDCGGGVATVSLNRPPVRNAFNQAMIAELTDIFGRLGGDEDASRGPSRTRPVL
jgi:methylglutaconyl-CoA hydratase